MFRNIGTGRLKRFQRRTIQLDQQCPLVCTNSDDAGLASQNRPISVPLDVGMLDEMLADLVQHMIGTRGDGDARKLE